ncbi:MULTISPECIES: hypothetical protein [unclassified Gordonia (in: high G+C Gram-positive bacteria)]
MPIVRRPQRQRWLRVVVVMLLGVAVALMHSLIAGTSTAGSRDGSTHSVASAQTAPSMATAGMHEHTDQAHLSDGDHCVLGHHCVSLRGDDVPLPPVILLILVWGFAALPVLMGIAPALIGRLGRPPPWAHPTHLTLSVIRC